jgi:hypothetical protein
MDDAIVPELRPWAACFLAETAAAAATVAGEVGILSAADLEGDGSRTWKRPNFSLIISQEGSDSDMKSPSSIGGCTFEEDDIRTASSKTASMATSTSMEGGLRWGLLLIRSSLEEGERD